MLPLRSVKILSYLFAVIIICSKLESAITHRPAEFKAEETEQKCGYEGCPKPKPNMLNIHIVAHTHDDVGWLKTVDQYYNQDVRFILDSVIAALLKDPTKRFIYVESIYFFKWWQRQPIVLKEQVKQLVNEGRLEFAGGAWSNNDEAATHYQSVIDQFTWGLRKLNDTFGECGRPKIGWQIDSYGHSREFASLLAQMGYDGLFLGRIDYEDLKARFSKRTTEMMWQTSENLGSKMNLFTSVLSNRYSPPPGFCFDYLCYDEPINDYNVDRRSDELINYSRTVQQKYRSNNILLTFGDDFHYRVAEKWFQNLDKLILHINNRQRNGGKVNIFYSTPSCYLKAVHDSNITLDTKSDDFFPYASDPHSFWTGYFTSRPTLKRFERIGNHYLQICKQLSAFSRENTPKFTENLSNLRGIMGVMQHHDAVTGTEQQHVANDYARSLQIGMDKCGDNIKQVLNQIGQRSSQTFHPKHEFDYKNCANLNISSCEITENSHQFMITLYNPLAHSTFQFVRLPVEIGEYEIRGAQNQTMNFQSVPIPMEIQTLPNRGRSKAKIELVFRADELPPVGYKSYFVQKKSKFHGIHNEYKFVTNPNASHNNPPTKPFTIGSKSFNLTFDENGFLASAASDNVKMNVRQSFYIYEGFAGSNGIPERRSSGAYVFRPKTKALNVDTKVNDIKLIRGNQVDEVHQTFNKWISQVVRIYKNESKAEFQWLVGPIPTNDGVGREIISRFDTDISSNGIFYTDSNGREILRRQRDHRDTWNLTLDEKVSGNYYPVTAKIAIEDDARRFALLTDRAQGGSSLTDGSIELMVHRRLLRDDGFGVAEALNERAFGKGLIARGSTYFVFGSKKYGKKQSTEANERFTQLQTHLPVWPLFSDLSSINYDAWKSQYNHVFTGLSQALPKNIHLLTFEPWTLNSILVRFEHIFAKDEDRKYSQSVSFDVQKIFHQLHIVLMRETTLSANQWLDHAKRLNFTTEMENANANDNVNGTLHMELNVDESNGVSNFKIVLNPMEIRTFIIKLKQ